MTLSLAEGLVDEIASVIEAGQVAKLAALDAEYADGITLEATVATYKGLKSLVTVPNYPVLYVIAPEQGLRLWEVSATAAAVEARPRLYAGVLAIDADGEQLQKRLYRYARAIVELLLDAVGAGSLAGWSLSVEEEWAIDTDTSPFRSTQDSEASSFIGEVSVGMRANKIETK